MELDKIVLKIRNSTLYEDDVLKYGRILITAFAKEYHTKQLNLGVSCKKFTKKELLNIIECIDCDIQNSYTSVSKKYLDDYIKEQNKLRNKVESML